MKRRRPVQAIGLLLTLLTALPVAAGTHYDMTLTLDPLEGGLQGSVVVRPEADGRPALRLAPELTVESVRVDGAAIAYERQGSQLRPGVPFGPRLPLEVIYSGRLAEPPAQNGPLQQAMLIGAEGSFLPDNAGWYPVLSGPIDGYTLDLTVMSGHNGVAPGRLLSEEQDGERYRARFAVEHAIDGIAVFAGPYEIAERRLGEIRLRTYFHAELRPRSAAYLDGVEIYLQRYGAQIGAYPFSAFHVVSSPLPVGLGYPYLTYIGRRVLQLPFILYTSLPHEVLHSWWGNGVFVDYGRGNWAEGLTTYMADYALAGARGPQAQREMRARWLADYAALPSGRDGPLTGFRARTHGAAQVIGYHKAAMLFHMLEKQIGAAAFAEGLREFWRQQKLHTAGWRDLQRAFEQTSGQSLSGFFAQWLQRTGAPQLVLDGAVVEETATGYRVRMKLGQQGQAYDLSVPVRLETEAGATTTTVALPQGSEEIALDSVARPTLLSVDPDFDLFRRLPPGDAPALLREVMLAETVALEVEEGDAAYARAARQLAARLAEGRIRDGADASGPLLRIGRTAWLGERAGGKPPVPTEENGAGTALVRVGRDGDGRLVATIAAHDAAALTALLRPLPHYGSKSYIDFDGSRAVRHGVLQEPPRSTTIYFD